MAEIVTCFSKLILATFLNLYFDGAGSNLLI